MGHLYKDENRNVEPAISHTLFPLNEMSVPTSHYATILNQFLELQKRENALRSIPTRLGLFDHYMAESIKEEFDQVEDGLNVLNLRDVAGCCQNMIDDFRAIIYNADSPDVLYYLDDFSQTLQSQSNEFHNSTRTFKRTCEHFLIFLEDQADMMPDYEEPDRVHHRPDGRRFDIKRMFHRSPSRARYERHQAPQNPQRTIRAMANDCETFMGGLGVFSDFLHQLIQEVAKFQSFISEQYATQDHVDQLDAWLTNMQSILQNYQ